MLLEIHERRIEPDVTVVELAGKLSLGRESQKIETLVEDLGRRGALKTIMDMSRVDYIDSAGIGLIALAAGKLREAGGRLVVVAGEGKVLQLLNLTQVSMLVTVCPTVDEAVASFGRQANA
jgi:anti-anti-sigma factor